MGWLSALRSGFTLFFALLFSITAIASNDGLSPEQLKKAEEWGRNPRAFILTDIPEMLQKYGYDNFCRKLDQVFCDKLPHREYEGMLGIPIGEKPIKKDAFYEWWKVELFNGKVFFYKVYGLKDGEDFREKGQEVMPFPQWAKGKSRENKPVLEGSNALVESYSSWARGMYSIAGIEDEIREDTFLKAIKILEFREDRSLDAELLSAMQGMMIEEDRFENRFVLRSAPYHFSDRNFQGAVSMRIFIKNGKAEGRVRITYSGDDWIFANSYVLLAGDERVSVEGVEFERDHNGSGVWEWIDFPITDEFRRVLPKILEDGESAIRFYGENYYKDLEFLPMEKKALKGMLSVLSAYKG